MDPFLGCADEILKCLQINVTEPYFPEVVVLYKVVLIFESVDEIIKCNHSNKSAVCLFGAVFCHTR